MFSSDSAINTKKEDKLNRAPFSEHLGHAILEWTKKETMVIGLYGEWGSGKSSIVNLALEYINSKTKKDKTSAPIIFRFNPWNFTEQNQLVAIFLSELSKAIGHQGKSEQAKTVGIKLLSYSKIFTPLSMLAPFFPHFAKLMKLPEETLKEIGNAAKEWAELNEKDLLTLKTDLDKQISKMDRKIIIVIDDIDRLNKIEIRQIFQLVKMNANFPNTIYILSLDDQKVARLLTEESFPGNDYLEKIVQVPFHVPTIEKIRVEKILFKEIDSIIQPYLSKSSPFDNKKWQNIYYDGLSGLFPSLRRVNRYINSLHFTITLIPNEINVIDFIGIEAIRVFFPDVYSKIATNKSLFVGNEYAMDHDDRKTKMEKVQKIINIVPDPDRKFLSHLIHKLFPRIYNNYTADWEDTWEGQKLICSRFRFDRYFFLSVPEGQMSQQEVDNLIAKASEIKTLEKSLVKLIETNKIRKFLTRLPDFKERIPQKNISNFITAVFNVGDSLPQEREHDFDYGATMEATRIAYHLLNNISDEKKRQHIAIKVIQDTSGIIAPTEFVSFEVKRMQKNDVSRLFTDNSFTEKLIQIMCKKIEERSTKDKLESVPNLLTILHIWKDWGGEEKAKELLLSMQDTTNDLGRILEGFCWQKHFGNSKDAKLWDIDIKSLQSFTDIAELKVKIAAITKNDTNLFSPRQKIALKLFNKKINQSDRVNNDLLTEDSN